ncbi:MFS transporter [Rhizobium sp. PP-CC-3G-465]|uniref:MFS transporter n=1 Tax=Rhizobium sp. PP-CC-3G-465 TaxID=2135648 RepID=UPI0010E36A9D|nr:MFS transporter [Rhizobium sp. PP-CC-3G-465]
MTSMRAASAPFLFAGTIFAAAGYGATFLFSAYIRARGGDDIDTGLALGAAMIGTFAGVPLVGWFSGRIDAARMTAIAAVSIACGFLVLAFAGAHGIALSRVAGALIGLGWGMFYIGAPMALSERVTDADRGFWFTRFGAFQMAGIGGGPVLVNLAIGDFGLAIETAFLLVAFAALAASILLLAFGNKSPLPRQGQAIRPWVRDIARIAPSHTIRPILMVGLGACVFSGLMSFQSSLVEGTKANASSFFILYAVTVVGARITLARFLARLPQSGLAIGLLLVMICGVAAMFGVPSSPVFQMVSAVLTGIGYGLVYPVIQTWAVNSAAPEHRHAALTWFVLIYFVGIFGFPVLGGWILVNFGKGALLSALLFAAVLEVAIATFAITFRKSAVLR